MAAAWLLSCCLERSVIDEVGVLVRGKSRLITAGGGHRPERGGGGGGGGGDLCSCVL